MIKLLIKHQLIDYCIKYACDIIIGNFKNIDLLEDFLKAYPVFSITFKEDRIINMGTMSYDTG